MSEIVNLQSEIKDYYGQKGLNDIVIPSHIKDNLSKELREYQKLALKYYLANCNDDKFKKNHLMFNMATGSGKTLIMAALMLDCYKRGYRDFVFFVNSTAILEKTRANFCGQKSSKYLFKNEIIIENQRIQINEIANLNESREGAINIYFSTIQGLFSLLTNEKENSITLQDLKDKKIVFLADEAHHLNAGTKLNKEERENKEGWEGLILQAFASNKENIMFEFSATIPQFETVLEKYKDKTVFEYALKSFYDDKYSKKIYLLKYDNDDLAHRFLGAILMNVFRQLLAMQYKLKAFKAVILFKSEFEKTSLENEKLFKEFIEKLNIDILKNFCEELNALKDDNFLKMALEYFREYFQKDDFYSELNGLIKALFSGDFYIINMNNKKDEEKRQILINSLEDKDNLVRVIFAVDKLNEGWDVLNLFDIVRLSKEKNTKSISTKEAQLIGRGARYYPFAFDDVARLQDEGEFKRKFDDKADEKFKFLQVLEALSYHTLNDVDFINDLNKSLAEAGLHFENMRKKIVLKPQKSHLELKSIKVATNKRVEKSALFDEVAKDEWQKDIKQIPLLASVAISQAEVFDKDVNVAYSAKQDAKISNISQTVFLKALNKTKLSFLALKRDFKDIKSKEDFLQKYIYPLECSFHKLQKFGKNEQILIASFVLDNLKSFINERKLKKNYEVLPFSVNDFDVNEREIYSEKEAQNTPYTWLLYDKALKLTKEEKAFLAFIERKKDSIDEAFEKWLIVRNEQFSELKIYDNREQSLSYGVGFEPDFIFWAKRKNNEEIIIQCFMEAKGGHLAPNDENKWKEEFLQGLKGEIVQKSVKINGLKFYIKDKESEFNDEFKAFIKDKG